jgi:hypothetical protein
MNQFVILFEFRARWKQSSKGKFISSTSISSGLRSSLTVDGQSLHILMSLSVLRFALTFFISAVAVCCMLLRLSCLLTCHNRLFAPGTDIYRALLRLSHMQKGMYYVQIWDNIYYQATSVILTSLFSNVTS